MKVSTCESVLEKVGASKWRLSESECVLHFVHVHIT